jgi:hypothetical protein
MANPIFWDDLKQTADDIELQIHLAGMDARERWEALKPQLVALGKTIAKEGDRAGQVVTQQMNELGAALRRLRDDIAKT